MTLGTGPLKGLRILEFAGLGPAPFCGMMFSDLGADVIRIDRANGAPYSEWEVISRGRRLNERLAVNGIQKGSRSLGTVATLAMGASLYGGGPDAGVRRSAAHA